MTQPLSVLKEQLMAWASEGPHRDELVAARAEFFKETGEVRSDEPTFDAWMDAFVDWYLCERPLGGLATPVQRYLKERGADLPSGDLAELQALNKTRRSMFSLLRLHDGGMVVRDLFHDERLEIIERRKPLGVQARDVFDARVVPMEGGWWLTGAPLYHPTQVRNLVARIVRTARTEGEERFQSLLRELALRRLRVDRYKRVEPESLYKDLAPTRKWIFF